MKSRKSFVSIGFIPLNPIFQCSIIPVFPPGHSPYGPEANWGESPRFILIKRLIKWSNAHFAAVFLLIRVQLRPVVNTLYNIFFDKHTFIVLV